MSVPPLHDGVLSASKEGIRLADRNRDRHTVYDVEHRDHNDQRAVEPIRDVNRLHFAICDRTEEHDSEGEPYDCDADVERPFKLGVFLT